VENLVVSHSRAGLDYDDNRSKLVRFEEKNIFCNFNSSSLERLSP
jgi:hypothetical protein